MRHFTTAAIAAAMLVPGWASINANAPVQAADDRLKRGTYRSTWGAATVADGPRGRISITFEDGSYISIEPGSRLIGHWLRPRGRDGRDPRDVAWARRCDRPTSAHPIATADPRTPWWGTTHVTVDREGRVFASFASCSGLPHNIQQDQPGLRMWFVAPPPRVSGAAARNPRRLDGIAERLARVGQRPCGAPALAIAAPDNCRMEQSVNFALKVYGSIPAGNGRVIFTPLLPDSLPLLRFLNGDGPMPVNTALEPVTVWFRSSAPFTPGNWLPLDQPRTLCAADLWALSMVEPGGRRHASLGFAIAACGPGTLRLGEEDRSIRDK